MEPIKILFFTPLLASGLLFCLPQLSRLLLKQIALGLSLIPLLVIGLKQSSLIGSTLQVEWLPALNIHFHLSIDGISLLFLFLTALIVPISLMTVEAEKIQTPKFFYSLVLLLQSFLIGFFTAQDLALFTLFWEAMLLPMYFIIGMWGRERSKEAAVQFLIYMLAGSVFLIAAVLALYLGTGSFDLKTLSQMAQELPQAKWIFWVFVLAFAVKTPLFPFHAWLPNAYTRSSIAGTILLAAVLSKAGIYGIARIVLPLFPDLIQQWGSFLLTFAIAGVIYGGWAACTQKDFKRLIAYSSFSHVNFVLAGLFVWQTSAHSGALLQAFNHGITIAGLFLAAHWLELRLKETMITERRGLAKFMPQLCWLTLVFVLSSIALPGTNSFVGEILIFFGCFKVYPWFTPFLGLTVVLSAVYSLRFMQKIYFEAPSLHKPEWIDIKWKEWGLALPLILLILWIGIYPAPFLKLVQQKQPPKNREVVELIQKSATLETQTTNTLEIKK